MNKVFYMSRKVAEGQILSGFSHKLAPIGMVWRYFKDAFDDMVGKPNPEAKKFYFTTHIKEFYQCFSCKLITDRIKWEDEIETKYYGDTTESFITRTYKVCPECSYRQLYPITVRHEV